MEKQMEKVWCYTCHTYHPVTCWQDVYGLENMGCSLDLAGNHPYPMEKKQKKQEEGGKN